MRLFIDTWGWVVLENSRETRPVEVEVFYREFRWQGGVGYTTDFVLDESFTLIFRRRPFNAARGFIEWIQAAIEQGYLRLEHITPERFEKAKQLRLKYNDKPRVSFTDFTSMVVMSELGITNVLTEDDHFIQVGMGFVKVPS